MMNNRSSLSSQRAALEAAACKEEDSPPPVHSPQNTNRGKLDQKLDSKMEMDDDKSELNDIKIKTEDSEDRKMGSKTWIEQGEIKKEKTDGDSMDATEGGSGNWSEFGAKDIKREVKMETDDTKIKIKEEAMSPSTSDNSQALVKSELKLEPVPNTTDTKKKCSKLRMNFYHLKFIIFFFYLAFKPDELCDALMPTLEKLIRLEPESIPFRSPVDPIALGIPDYLDIIKKPMDLGTVEKKLRKGEYSDPWEYVDDVWLMFDNAWLYNRKTSRVYRYCTKVRNTFLKKFM